MPQFEMDPGAYCMPDGVNIGRRLGVKSRADRQIQRRKSFDGRHVVGGHAVLTTITASGVVQRVVHVWPEDQPGKRIEPAPLDWSVWRARRVAA